MSKELDQMNLVLGKAGWRMGGVTKHGPIHIKYAVERIADGRTAFILQDLPELLLQEIRSDEMRQLTKDTGLDTINPFIALRLLLLVRAENKKYPPPQEEA